MEKGGLVSGGIEPSGSRKEIMKHGGREDKEG